MTKVIEYFEGTPVSQLGWWDLLRYNVALTQANVACGAYATGTVKESVYARYGITFEVANKVVQP